MCKRKRSTKRRPASSESAARTVDPVAARTNNIPPMPPEMLKPSKDGKHRVASLGPTIGLVMPTTGKAALKRVFLGLGWAASNGQQRGIIYSCDFIPYSLLWLHPWCHNDFIILRVIIISSLIRLFKINCVPNSWCWLLLRVRSLVCSCLNCHCSL